MPHETITPVTATVRQPAPPQSCGECITRILVLWTLLVAARPGPDAVRSHEPYLTSDPGELIRAPASHKFSCPPAVTADRCPIPYMAS
jgi:hypothetical protein